MLITNKCTCTLQHITSSMYMYSYIRAGHNISACFKIKSQTILYEIKRDLAKHRKKTYKIKMLLFVTII